MMLVSQLLYSVHVWRTDLKLSTTTTTPPGWGWGHASPELFKVTQLLLLLLGGAGDMLPQNFSKFHNYYYSSWVGVGTCFPRIEVIKIRCFEVTSGEVGQ